MKDALTILMLVLLIGPLLIAVRRIRRIPRAVSRQVNPPADSEIAARQGILGSFRFNLNRNEPKKRD